jgi:hypothetical protein
MEKVEGFADAAASAISSSGIQSIPALQRQPPFFYKTP